MYRQLFFESKKTTFGVRAQSRSNFKSHLEMRIIQYSSQTIDLIGKKLDERKNEFQYIN